MRDKTVPIIIVDSREQCPFNFGPFPIERRTLKTGDYSVKTKDLNLVSRVAIERKSLPDLLGCIGQSRQRFERELVRLSALEYGALVFEFSMLDLLTGGEYSDVHPRAAI